MPSAPTMPAAPIRPATWPLLLWRGGGSWLAAFPGGASGRLIATDGTARFVLGVEDYDESVILTVGDYVEVYQVMSLDDVDLVIFDAAATVGIVAAGRTWYAKVLVDDVELAAVALAAEATQDAAEAVAPVRRYTGDHCVAFRLEAG